MPPSDDSHRSHRRRPFARAVALLGGFFFISSGAWGMVAPASFFATAARFEPYNQHFLQDIGAFQIGLGAVLLIAAVGRWQSLTVGLLGVGVGSAAHTVSHLVGLSLGGTPALDIPLFGALTALLLAAGLVSMRGSDA